MQQRMTLANQPFHYEPQVNVLYNTLKLLKTTEDRAKLLHDQSRVPNGLIIIEGTLLLFVSKLQSLRKKEWHEHCELPPLPGNQEDEATINAIDSAAKKIKERYQPAHDYLSKIIAELSAALPGPKYQCESFNYAVYFAFDGLLRDAAQNQLADLIQRKVKSPDDLKILKQALELAGAIYRASRKELWDQKKELTNPALASIEAILRQVPNLIASYSPSMFSRSSSQLSASVGSLQQSYSL